VLTTWPSQRKAFSSETTGVYWFSRNRSRILYLKKKALSRVLSALLPRLLVKGLLYLSCALVGLLIPSWTLLLVADVP
jgi:hypothetical protein